MSTAEIAKLEEAGRASMAPEADVYASDADLSFMLKTVMPVFGILVLAAAVFLSVM